MLGLKHGFCALVGAVGLSLLTTTASGSTISLVYNGTDVARADREVVTFSRAPVRQGTSAYAFGFNMADVSQPSHLNNFLAWCLDIGSNLSTSSTRGRPYSITNSPFGNSYVVNPSSVQDIFDANFGSVNTMNGVEAAGFQVALWNAVYDQDARVDGGIFRVSARQSVIDQANSYLDAAMAYRGKKLYSLSFLESTPDRANRRKYQNLVTASLIPAPVPAAGGMLIVALASFGIAARRRKAHAQSS